MSMHCCIQVVLNKVCGGFHDPPEIHDGKFTDGKQVVMEARCLEHDHPHISLFTSYSIC